MTGTWTFDDALLPTIRVIFRKKETQPTNAPEPTTYWNQILNQVLTALAPFPDARVAVTQLLLAQARE